MGNYAAWKQGGGIPGDGTSPAAASPDFITCLTSVLHPPYGVYGVLICIGLLAVLLLMVMRMGYSDTGEYDTDRNFVYSAKGTYGTSGWMGRKEMKGVLDLVPDLRKHKGIVLGMLDGKAVCIPENPRINGNLAVYGSSGSMKTRSFCMNRILQAVIRGESLIISDPKSELYEKSSEYLREQGYCVKVFNLVLPENSDSWNCLSEVEGQELMAQLFVDVIIKNTNSTGKGDHFWDSCEMNLLKALVLYVDQSYAKENRNIGEVYRLLTLNGESDLDSLFDVLPPTHPAKAPYSLFKQASDTVRSGVIIGLGSRLQVFQSELIKKITTRDEIDLELPGQERCAYFLVTSDQDSTFDFLASLFLSFCFIKLVRYADKNCEGGKLPVPVHILGEELTACGTIPDLSRRLSVIRSRNISMSCVFQNLAGLQNRYPLNLWQEILGNCDAQLFLGCTDSLTAEFISERTGLASVSVSSKSKQLGTWRISNYTPEYRETSGVGKRPVLTPDEVLRLPITQALVIIRGQKALKVEKMDYSKHPESSKLRDCKASAHIPEWRKLEEQAQPKPAAAPSPAPKPKESAPKKPAAKRKPKSAGTPAAPKSARVTACFRGPGRDHHHRQGLDPFLNSQHKEVFTYGNQEKGIAGAGKSAPETTVPVENTPPPDEAQADMAAPSDGGDLNELLASMDQTDEDAAPTEDGGTLPELTESEMFGAAAADTAAADALPGEDDTAALTEGPDSDDGEDASAVPADDRCGRCPR